jgi:hypothetical protein
VIDGGLTDFVNNNPRACDERGSTDGYLVRRLAMDAGMLIKDLELARSVWTP